MILVTGATGNVGSQVVEQLSSAGAPVRAFVHDPEKAANVRETGVEIAEGGFQRPETLDAALEGVDRLFLLMGTAEDQVELENDIIDAAARAGIRRVVKLSIYGAEIGSPVPFRDWHGRIEARLEGSGLGYTHLRPTFFMQNAAYMLAPDGVFYLPSGDGRIGWVDVRDVAAVAVRALTEDGHEGKAYDITGPESLSFAEAAERISAATGRGDYGLGARLALGGGLALYLAGIAFVDRVNEGARNGAVLPARLGAAALLLGLSFAGSPLSPLAFIAMVVAVLLALTAFETMRPSP